MALTPTSPQMIPAEFADRLSDELLLQPDAEFIFARWAYSEALAAGFQNDPGFEIARMQLMEGRLPVGGGGGIPGNWTEAMSSGQGGPLMLSKGMVYPGLVKMVQEAKGPGENIKIDRPKFIDGATTESLRKLAVSDKIFGTNSQPITMEQVDVLILAVGGPGDSAGHIVPIHIPRFTQHRSHHQLLPNVGYQLRRDRNKYLDDLIMGRFITAASTGGWVTRPQGISVITDYTGSGNEPMSFDLIVSAAEQLKTRKIPGIGGAGKYVAVLDLHQIAQLKLDPQFQRQAVFLKDMNPIVAGSFPGATAEVENLIVCESNRMPRLTNLGAGANLTGYQGIVTAPGAIGWGLAEDARVLTDKNDDGGRNAQFAWEAYEGWNILDDRFVQTIVTD